MIILPKDVPVLIESFLSQLLQKYEIVEINESSREPVQVLMLLENDPSITITVDGVERTCPTPEEPPVVWEAGRGCMGPWAAARTRPEQHPSPGTCSVGRSCLTLEASSPWLYRGSPSQRLCPLQAGRILARGQVHCGPELGQRPGGYSFLCRQQAGAGSPIGCSYRCPGLPGGEHCFAIAPGPGQAPGGG